MRKSFIHNMRIFCILVSRCWHPVRSKPGPGFLHSHSAVKLKSWMVLFGGEREGQTVNEVWRFHFGEFSNSFEVLQTIILSVLHQGSDSLSELQNIKIHYFTVSQRHFKMLTVNLTENVNVYLTSVWNIVISWKGANYNISHTSFGPEILNHIL